MRKVSEAADGVYQIAMEGFRCPLLMHLLDPNVPHVLVRGYMPTDLVRWWECPVVFREGGPSHRVQVRQLGYDFQMPTQEFLSILDDFADSGIELYQATRKIPETLLCGQVDPDSKVRILKDNGVTNWLLLPHANEVAIFWTTDRLHYERLLVNDHVRALML